MKRENELTLDEWDKILSSLGNAPYWFTISGGEPLLYPHIVELARLAYERCHPAVLNIPTNAISPTVPERVERISQACPDTQLIVNLSLDGIGSNHDKIRGVPGNFQRFEACLKSLLQLRNNLTNLTIGIHTVISVFNANDVESIVDYAEHSGANQFITEIAEPRMELDTVGLPITPDAATYGKAVDKVIAYLGRRRFAGLAGVTEALRIEYYKLVKRILEEQDQVIDCYAGWASGHIYADGTVWPCCVRADNVGNLRDHNYDFRQIWFSKKMESVRKSIAAKECHCPLANAAYTNMLHHPATAFKVAAQLVNLSTSGSA